MARDLGSSRPFRRPDTKPLIRSAVACQGTLPRLDAVLPTVVILATSGGGGRTPVVGMEVRLQTSQTARAWFDEMLRVRVAPGMRRLGLVGSRQSFRLPAEGYWAQIGVQKSVSSTAEHVQFTLNLSVISALDWEHCRSLLPHTGSRPSANVCSPRGWYERIGAFMRTDGRPEGDHWWVLHLNQPFDQIADHVLEIVGAHGLPELRRHIDGYSH